MPLATITQNRCRTGNGCFVFVCAAAGALVPLALRSLVLRGSLCWVRPACVVWCVSAVVGSVVGGGRASLVLGSLAPVCGPLVPPGPLVYSQQDIRLKRKRGARKYCHIPLGRLPLCGFLLTYARCGVSVRAGKARSECSAFFITGWNS